MTRLLFLIISLLYCGYNAMAQFNYPASKTVDSSDTWHNITIKDPYRWMENLESEETQKWFKAQNNFTDSLLKNLPHTDELYHDFLKIDSIEPDKIKKVRQVGRELFYFNQKVEDTKQRLCKRNGEFAKEQVVAEYTMWGENYKIYDYEIDPYQKYIVVHAAESGKEVPVTKFYDIAKAQFVKDSLPGTFYGYAPGEGNVYYMQQPSSDGHVMKQDKDRIIKVHKIGTDTLQDKTILSYELNPDLYVQGKGLWPLWIDKGCNYELLVSSSVPPYLNAVYYRKINTNNPWKKIINDDDEITGLMGTGNKLYLISTKEAPNSKILFMDMVSPDFSKAKLLVKEKDIPLTSIDGSKNYLILAYMKNGVQLHYEMLDIRTNTLKKNPFPETTSRMSITPFNLSNDDVHIVRTGWITPFTYTYSNIDKPFPQEKRFAFRKEVKYPFIDEAKVEEIEITGYDGIKIPVSIISNKNLKKDKTNIAFLESYGAYGINYPEATFNTTALILAHKNVMYVVPHVRGGSEKGEYWRLGGYKQSKPNTWKDFNSTAEYLIAQGYTSPEHLACQGGSAGGILIGRAVTERPDLWACALPQIGVLNTVRMEFSPNGPANIPEFGTVKNINEFFAVMETDATLHLQDGVKYPAMLISTGWNDPRVISWQPGKFAAAAQKANASDKPILLEVDFNGGHGDSVDKFADFKKIARQLAFVLEQCGYDKPKKQD